MMAKRYFPAFLDLEGQTCVVVGGGKIAVDKIDGLLQAGAGVTVVAPRISPRISAWAREGTLQVVARAYRAGDLEGAVLVIAATDDAAVNQQVYEEGVQRHLLVNVVDVPAQCNYITPSVVRRGQLLVAISTQGAAPALAAAMRRYLERRLDERVGAFLEQATVWRRQMKREEASVAARRTRWHRLIGRAAPSLLGVGPPVAIAAETRRFPLADAGGEGAISLRQHKTAYPGSVGIDLFSGRIEDLEVCQAALVRQERVHEQLTRLRHRDGSPLLEGWVVVAASERAEVFYQTTHPRLARRALHAWFTKQLAPERFACPPESYTGLRAIEHLFRVACGLCSAVPLETAVRGILRRALLNAGMNNTLPVSLEQAFRAALALPKRVCEGGAYQATVPESMHALIRLAAARIPRFDACWFAIIMDMPWAAVARRMLTAEGASTSRILCLQGSRAAGLADDLLTAVQAGEHDPDVHLVLLTDSSKGTFRLSRATLRALLSGGVSRLWVIDAGIPRVIPAEAASLHGVTVWERLHLFDQRWANSTHEAQIAAVRARLSQLAAEYYRRHLAPQDDSRLTRLGVEAD